MDARFTLNLDGVVAIRGLRGGRDPDPVAVALLAQLAGAHGLSLSVRDDRRGGQERDLRMLRESVTTHFELRLSPAVDLVSLAFDTRPDRVTLVAERRDGESSATGLDVHLLRDALRKHVQHLRDADVEIAFSIAPDLDQVKAAHRLDADCVVLTSNAYAAAATPQERRLELTRLLDAATTAARLGIRVAVGGGIDLRRAEEVARIPHATEFQVGQACLARALLVGVERGVADFIAAIARGRQRPL
ncbi:pyridoxine 5'-phosphate synthase [Myxococcota bacterium]|nr:pyridoxine 5'-phosphate synthase [Myxococcota bacterium]